MYAYRSDALNSIHFSDRSSTVESDLAGPEVPLLSNSTMKARLYWFRYFFKYIVSRELKKANIQLPSDPAQLELVQQKHEAIIWQKLKNGELEYLNTYQFWTILFHHYGITGDGVVSGTKSLSIMSSAQVLNFYRSPSVRMRTRT